MQTKEDNEILTRVGPGTPMGELFRRFWLPALLSEELPGPDCTPVRARLLGEDLIAFRDSNGRVGVVDAYCPHRSAPMFFGRNEEGGLRCVYHGWKFDVDGNCVDMPNCMEGESFKNKIKIPSYHAWEGGGMVWIYMGPADKVPPKPAYEWLEIPPENRYVQKYVLNCNYLQTLENEFDIGHSAWLHSNLVQRRPNSNRQGMTVRNLKVADYSNSWIVDTDFGSALIRKMEGSSDTTDVYSFGTPFWMPSFSAAGAAGALGVFPLNLKLPVDDESSVFFRLKWSEKPIPPEIIYDYKHGNNEFPQNIPGTFVPIQSKSNDYQIDRVKQRFFSWTGIINYPLQDFAVVENQRGPITDRTKEHLCSSDTYLLHMRWRLLNAAKALMRGEEPKEPWNPEAYRIRMRQLAVPAGTPKDVVIRLFLHPEEAEKAGRSVKMIEVQHAMQVTQSGQALITEKEPLAASAG
jgi:phenylpropionate dioxygenase-like ring-hydroxylating dioxygenase large terminal subunit